MQFKVGDRVYVKNILNSPEFEKFNCETGVVVDIEVNLNTKYKIRFDNETAEQEQLKISPNRLTWSESALERI